MDYQELIDLHAALGEVLELIDDAPQRFESNLAGELAEADYDDVLRARSVIHRLYLWSRYAAQSPESYLPSSPSEAPHA
jgi:hypothetical protein